MSIGQEGVASLYIQDEKSVIYKYYVYNYDIPELNNKDRIEDGFITIEKDAFVEPEIHEKIKRLPNGKKKLITKKIIKYVDIFPLITNKKIIVETSKYDWKINDLNIGEGTRLVLCEIFEDYQKQGQIPEWSGFIK